MKKGTRVDFAESENPKRTWRHTVTTGEFRAPKKGEWFVSGAIPEAYRALRDMEQEYHIAVPVSMKLEADQRTLDLAQRIGALKPKKKR